MNIAFSDDYNEILKIIDQILDANSFTEAFRHFMYGVGYSKPLTMRLIALLHLKSLHEINFRYLIFTGNVFLLPACLIYMAATSRSSKLLGITVACFVFQPQYWEAIYQSTLSNSVFPCLFFSLAALYCATREPEPYNKLALVFALLAQLSFGNGFLVYPLLIAIALWHKNVRFALVTFIQTIVSTWLYMFGTTVEYSTGKDIPFVTQLKLITVWIFEFTGSAVGYILSSSGYNREMPGSGASIVIGVLVLFFYCYLVWTKYYQRNLTLFTFLTFFLLTAVLAAKLRFNQEVPGASRYQIQSALCLATVLCIIVDRYRDTLGRTGVVIIALIIPALFTTLSYKNTLVNVTNHRTRLISDMLNWQNYGYGLTIWGGRDEAARTLVKCSNRGIHHIPTRPYLYKKIWEP